MHKKISLDISSACNLRCAMCSLDKFYKNKGFMDFELFKRILPDLKDFQIVHLGWCGEPLLHPRALDIIRLLKKSNLVVELTTNGNLLSKEGSDILVSIKLDKLNISIDASTKELYERIRLLGNFDLMMANVRYYMGKKSADQEVNMVSTIFSENIDDMKNLVALAKKSGFHNLSFNMAVPHFLSIKSSDSMILAEIKEKMMRSLAEEDSEFTILKPSFEETKGCRFLTPAITPEGDVVPCPLKLYDREAYFSGKKVLLQKHSFGNLRKSALSDIIGSKEFSDFVNSAKQDYKMTCAGCVLMKGYFCP